MTRIWKVKDSVGEVRALVRDIDYANSGTLRFIRGYIKRVDWSYVDPADRVVEEDIGFDPDREHIYVHEGEEPS